MTTTVSVSTMKVAELSAPGAADAEDTMRFAELSGVRPMIETYRSNGQPKPMRAC